MLRGAIPVLDEGQMERLHQAALNVLEATGLMIRGDFLLKALADARSWPLRARSNAPPPSSPNSTASSIRPRRS